MFTANVKLNPYNAAGNGIADDRAAIQSAIDAVAAADGGCVFFPKGVYLIGTEPGGSALGGLQMKANVLLQGEAPRAAVLKLANGTNSGAWTDQDRRVSASNVERLRYPQTRANGL